MPSAIPGDNRHQSSVRLADTLPMQDDMDLPDYACLLHDAARASAAIWAEPCDQHGHDRAVRHLSITLQEMRVVAIRLAGRYSPTALAQPDPSQAAAAVGTVLALEQAWLILEHARSKRAAPAGEACVPGDLLCFAARRMATWPLPLSWAVEVTLPMADALAALEDGTGCLASGADQLMAECLTEVRRCLKIGVIQLRSIPRPAVPRVTASWGRPASVSCAVPSCDPELPW